MTGDSRRREALALAIVLTGTFMGVLDFFIVNVALPPLQHDLGASAGSIEWVVAGYALSAGVLLVTGSRLGERVGRRRALSVGLALFTAASALCGAAWSASVLVVARLIQGCGFAFVMPNVLALLTQNYQGEARARAIKAYGLTMGLAAIGGQLLGGALIAADWWGLGWRSCFLINIPIGVAAIALAPRFVAESRGETTASIDVLGTLLLTTVLAATLLPLVDGRQQGWPTWSWLSLAAAVVGVVILVSQQLRLARRGRSGLLDPALLRQRSLAGGLATQVFFWSGQGSYFLVLVLYLQDGRGLSALQTGLLFTLVALPYVVASLRSPTLLPRHGRRLVTGGALSLVAGHLLLLAAVQHVGNSGSVALLAPGLIMAGAGMGLVIAPLTTLALSGVDRKDAGSASMALTTMQNVGSALGVAVTGAIFFGALDGGYSHAFKLSLGELAIVLAGVALISRLLPGARATGPVVEAEAVLEKG